MRGIDWYREFIVINDYREGNIPEFLFLSFPKSITKRDCEMIELSNKALGFNTTKFYKRKTIMVSFNN